MNVRTFATRTTWPALALLVIAPLAASRAHALAEHNVPKGVRLAADQGRVPADKEQTLSVFLKVHDQPAYDAAVKALYTPGSPTYHKWFTQADFAKYAPTAAELKSVRDELVKQGFSVLSEDPQNFSIRVHGTTATAEKAFQTQLHTFTLNKTTFQAHTMDAQLTGDAGKLVDSVVGLDLHNVHPQLTVVKNPLTGLPISKKTATRETVGSTLLSQITGRPLTPLSVSTFTTNGSEPIATFKGNTYDVNPALTVAYTPKELQTHYGLTPLFAQGYNGAHQTIALVEAYGYASAQSDANLAAATFGLPLFGSGNFETIYPEGQPVDPDAGDLEDWTPEIALDIQSAHAIAPGARIVVVASAGQDDEDQIASLQYIITHKVANTVSSSWENDDEIVAGSAEEDAFNSVLERGAAAGISFQFSSGDGGDLGLETPIGDLAIPSNSPWATAVGGTSILNNPAGGADIVTGWGSDLDYAELEEFGPFDPPNQTAEFYAGAGGGESVYFAKPSWQSALPGTGRQVPDVSALADPFTGFAIIFTDEGQLYTEAGIGGTSLASPIFSAIWAIADQYNGAPLGHAAPLVAALQPGQITDVIGTNALSNNNTTVTVVDSNGITHYNSDELLEYAYPAQTQTEFTTAFWNLGYEGIVLSFGTDSSLTVTPGWDNVTGYGEPNGLPFVQGVTGKTKGAPDPK
jgi:subtilase family serine protease